MSRNEIHVEGNHEDKAHWAAWDNFFDIMEQTEDIEEEAIKRFGVTRYADLPAEAHTWIREQEIAIGWEFQEK